MKRPIDVLIAGHAREADKAAYPNSRASWSAKDEATLVKYASGSMPVADIAARLGRSVGAVKRKAAQLGISLKPRQYSPYAED